MIHELVKSAFSTGCLSVASESLIRQLVASSSCARSDLEALMSLEEALNVGKIQREAKYSLSRYRREENPNLLKESLLLVHS